MAISYSQVSTLSNFQQNFQFNELEPQVNCMPPPPPPLLHRIKIAAILCPFTLCTSESFSSSKIPVNSRLNAYAYTTKTSRSNWSAKSWRLHAATKKKSNFSGVSTRTQLYSSGYVFFSVLRRTLMVNKKNKKKKHH